MKRNQKLLLLIGILVVCIAGYAILAAVSGEEAAPENPKTTVTDFSAGEVAALRWSYADEDAALSKTDDTWYNDSDRDFPVAQSKVSNMTRQISAITASRTLTGVEDFAQYGLEQPQLSVSLMTATGGELSFIFGDTNPVVGETYMQYSQGSSFTPNDTVYLVPNAVAEAFSCKLETLVQFETLPNLSDIRSVKVKKDESYRISYMGEETIPWTLRDAADKKHAANTSLCEELVTALQELAFQSCVSYNALNADLADYGLDDPWAEITVNYTVASDSSSEGSTDRSITISLGDMDENGNYCVSVEGMRMLYTVNPAVGSWLSQNSIASITNLSDML